MNKEKPESYSKLVRIFDEWDFSEMTVYLKEGAVLHGRSDGSEEVPVDIDADFIDDYRMAFFSEIKIIKLPENPKWDECKDGRKFLIIGRHRIDEGGGTGFDNLDEPDKIVLDDGRVIWDKARNFCLRFDFKTRETYEDKIR